MMEYILQWWKFGQGAPDGASKSKSGSLSKSKGNRKALGHEKLDVYRLAISYFVWVYESEEACAEETERVDPDSDSDLDEIKPQQGDGIPSPHR